MMFFLTPYTPSLIPFATDSPTCHARENTKIISHLRKICVDAYEMFLTRRQIYEENLEWSIYDRNTDNKRRLTNAVRQFNLRINRARYHSWKKKGQRFDRSGKISRKVCVVRLFCMDRNHRWDRLLGSFRIYIKPHALLSGTLHSDPFQTNRCWTICLDIMVLAYLLLHPRAPNRINLIHIHGTNLRVESRESRGRWKRGKSAEGSRWGWIGARCRGRRTVGERTFARASWILTPLPSHYSLHSDWITYNQHQTFLNSISCTRNRVFSCFFCVMKPLWEVRALFREESARRVCFVFVLRADVQRRQSLHRNCYLSFSFSLSLSSSFPLHLRQIRIDTVFIKEFLVIS